MTAPTTLRQALRAWGNLDAPDIHDVDGRWEAIFLPPLQTIAPLGLGLVGLPRWYGKQFEQGSGINLLRTDQDILGETLPMCLRAETSWSDGRPALVAAYAGNARRPWRWIRDEIRLLDSDSILALTFADAPGLRSVGLPFLLHRRRTQ